MKRKLRKSLSWLLTVAMIISLFCGMIPTASAVDDPAAKSSDLEITKEATEKNGYSWANIMAAKVGDKITYEITIENNATTAAENVVVSDTFFGNGVTSVSYKTEYFSLGIYHDQDKGSLSVVDGAVTIPSIPESRQRAVGDSYEPGKCTITYTYTVQRDDAAPYGERELVNQASVGGKSAVETVTIEATGGSANDSEFHIMNWEDLKDFVRDAYNLGDDEKITIHAIKVNGEIVAVGAQGSATGAFAYYTNKGDYGVQGSNGILAEDNSVWKVLNDADIILPETVTSITVLAKTGTGPLGYFGYELDPLTIYLDEDDIKLPLDDSLITEIYLTNASLEPIPDQVGYTIYYYYVDGEGVVMQSSVVDSVTADEVTNSVVTYKAFDELNDSGKPTGNYIFDEEKSSDSFVWTADKQVFNVYYALDENEDNVPDYQEKDDIDRFEKSLVTGTAPAGVTIPEGITVKYPSADETVIVPVNSSVTLMYQFTVEGVAGTGFTITDTGATAVGGDYVAGTSAEGSIAGVIPDSGVAVIYAIKTFTAADIDKDSGTGYLTNHAVISVDPDDTIAEGENQDDEDVPAEEGAPIPPTVVEANEVLDNKAVLIHCTTAESSFGHGEEPYGLLPNGYTIGATVGAGTEADPWRVIITVTPDPYVTQYGTEMGKDHQLNPDQGTQTITLNWDRTERAWVVASDVPVVYTVTCDDERLFNSREFHIMYLDEIKQAVADKLDLNSIEGIGIYSIYVSGSEWLSGEPATATGDILESAIYEVGLIPVTADQGYPGVNGKLSDFDAWSVNNINGLTSVNDDTITGITIYYKLNGNEGNVFIPCTDFEKVVRLEDKLITEIYLDTTSDEPGHNTYSVTYDWGEENVPPNVVLPGAAQYQVGAEVTIDTYYYENQVVTGSGYKYTFSGWKVPDGVTVADGKFTMPEGNVTITGTWAKEAVSPTPDLYMINVEVVNGSAACGDFKTNANGTGNFTAAVNTEYVITFTPANGYVFDSATLDGTAITLTNNTYTLKYDSNESSHTIKVVYKEAGGDTDPTAPEEEEVITLLGGKTVVGVDCTTDGTYGVHTDKSYELIEGSFTVGAAQQGADGTWTCQVVVSYEKYLEEYNKEFPGHKFVDVHETKSFTLTYNGTAWAYTGDVPAFTFDVACTAPEKPTGDQIEGAFTGNKTMIKVECITTGVDHPDQYFKELLDGSWTAGEVKLNSENQWTSVITVTAAQYVSAYQVKAPEHKPVGTQTKTFTLVLDGETWTYSGDSPAIVFDSACTVPEKPDDDQIPSILGAGDAILMHCVDSVDHGEFNDKTYDLWSNSEGMVRYEVTEPVLENGIWTCTVTILPDVYVSTYSRDTETTHWLDPATQTGEKIILTWDEAEQKWTPPVKEADEPWATFTVSCVPDQPGDEEIPTIVDPNPADDQAALIRVICGNAENTHGLDTKDYELWANDGEITRYTVGTPTWNKDLSAWTCTVIFNGQTYAARYSDEEEVGVLHSLAADHPAQAVILTWDAAAQKWTAPADLTNPIATFQVTCSPAVTDTVALTFNANGGTFVGLVGAEDGLFTKEGLEPGTHTLSSYVGANQVHHSQDGVVFAGWTTEEPSETGKVYRHSDTNIPEIVKSITIVDQNVTVWAVWGYDEDSDGTADINEVVITPADITIYTGGTGYGGVTNAEGDIIENTNGSGLPQPGYHIDLPADIQTWLGTGTTADNLENILHFEYNVNGVTRNWGMSYAGIYALDENDNPSRYVYTLKPSADGSGEEIPVRILYKDGNTIVDNDQIDMSATAAHEEYTMTINPGELDQSKIQAVLTKDGNDSKTLNVFIGTGTLTIRSVVEQGDNTSVIAANEASVAGSEVTAVGNGATYVVNDSEVSIDVTNNPDRVQLLVDKVSDSDAFDQAMEEASLTHAAMPSGACETAYLDLVDTENGNTVVTLGKGSMDIYWPMPSDAKTDGTFKVVHYKDMDRETTASEESLDQQAVEVLQGNEVSVVTIGSQQFIKFQAASFSPFALVYETEGTAPNPDPTPDDDNDDDQGGGSSGGSDDSDPTGSLSISVDVNGDGEFTFSVIFTDEDGDELENNFYYNVDLTGTIGSGDEITLSDGDTIVIRNLPVGTRYEIIIEDAGGFRLIASGEEGVIRSGMNEAEFTGDPVVELADPSVTGVDRWLNITDHIAYLTGYPTGGFGPDSSMTRAEVAQMFYALLNNKNVTITKTFPDVPADAWYATAVNTLATLGMVSGDANGNYRPNDPVTRAEFCTIALAFAYEPEDARCSFTDVGTGDWFYPYVAQAASYGWIGGYTDGSFGPRDSITRAQVTTIVNNMLGRAADRDYVLDHQEQLNQFNDLSKTHWAYFQIMEATNAHDYTKSDGIENWR